MSEKKIISGLIYVVDDDANVRKLVAVALKDAGFEVHEFPTCLGLLDAVGRQKPNAIILDWKMPEDDIDGMTLCGKLKLDSATQVIPIIMLTARVEEVDCVLALEMGVDDYLKKPFSIKELVTRVKSILRRKECINPSDDEEEVLSIGDIKVNIGNRTVVKSGKFLNLTMKEFDLLVNLINERSKVLTREQLMNRVWSNGFSGEARTVDVHIRYLRKKIEDKPESPIYVITVRGMGYRIASKEELRA
ncbi:MAG: response regulator transcription factor [Oscillospiraceae bacterium]|jgi:two-component system alkaline phosphatase synthesis response regulator PhoP|nr:response regulator transcription factor [Oscillospiraceae bacterium]